MRRSSCFYYSLRTCNLNHKHAKVLNTERTILSTDQSNNVVLTTNQKLSKEILSPRKNHPGVYSEVFMREQIQTTKSISTSFIFIENINKFDFTDLKIEKKDMNHYHHWGADKKITDKINKGDKSPETLLLLEKQQQITIPEAFVSSLILT